MKKAFMILILCNVYLLIEGCDRKEDCCKKPVYLFQNSKLNLTDNCFPISNLDTTSRPKILFSMPNPMPTDINGSQWFDSINFSNNSLLHIWFAKESAFYNEYSFELNLDTSLKTIQFSLKYIDQCDYYCSNSNFTLPVNGSVYFLIPKVDSTYTIDYIEVVQ